MRRPAGPPPATPSAESADPESTVSPTPAGARTARPGLGAVLAAVVSRRWWWGTLLALAGMALLVRLGFWQLDRLEQRRARNAATAAQLAAPPLLLQPPLDPTFLAGLADRQVRVSGRFDYARQFVLSGQTRNGQAGAALFAPLRIDGSDLAVLVNRGWIPAEAATSAGWARYDGLEAATVTGYLQPSVRPPRVTAASYNNRPEAPLQEWFFPFIDAIQQQMPYRLLPVYIQAVPDEAGPDTTPPLRQAPDFDLSEGNHLSYAVQWFLFAAVLGGVYLAFVRRQLRVEAD